MSEDRLDQLDYYTLLGVPEDAPADAIRAAFHRFAARYHPDRHLGKGLSERERAAQIFRRGTEAYRVLLAPDSRRLYDQGLARGELRLLPGTAVRRSTRPPGAYVPGALVARTARARPFLARAIGALEIGDLSAARLNLRIALQNDPGNPGIEAKLAEVEAKVGKG
ncbi:MAG: DnaJ domain-containing protein [Polyangiales bacterium]